MHFTLMMRFNLLLILVCALVVGALLSILHPRPLLLSIIGAGAGLVAGMLQRWSVRSSPEAFAGARSALDVRRAFRSNLPGTLSIVTMWATVLALLAVAWALGENPLGLFAGYASFMFAREIVALGVVGDLQGKATTSR
jgi:hypothetical protein